MTLSLSLCLAFVGIASATTLEDAVASYNSKAALLQGAWDDFQGKQSAAFVDVDGWLTGMHDYFLFSGTDNSAADAAWAAQQTAWAHLESTTSAPVQPALEALLVALDDAVDALQAAIEADTADPLAKAYSDGPMYFQLTDQPIMFWTDSGVEQPDIHQWMEFDFPHLYVGNNLHTSYVSLMSSTFGSWLIDIWDWFHFGHWVIKHKDDARTLQNDAKNKLDELCAACATCNRAYATDECFTLETLDYWCDNPTEEDGMNSICDTGYDADTANKYLTSHWQCWTARQVGKVEEVAQDYVESSWQDEFEWLQQP